MYPFYGLIDNHNESQWNGNDNENILFEHNIQILYTKSTIVSTPIYNLIF